MDCSETGSPNRPGTLFLEIFFYKYMAQPGTFL